MHGSVRLSDRNHLAASYTSHETNILASEEFTRVMGQP